ncbi:hypothetical protein A3SI_04592 [Nitritalea halalkaliphila LW7]|uniref:Uncharacterized protein n=1 Tax=Nitritalea halalkaliphila LW7 TaxID=1189621 RepID=I5C8B4_9BACT|nr:hypothetical protein [Nitritalea halalkaliphila]EIM78066.1 hypothetical protein A3SI_04592 [Nitritalea halalkaliphila LW7]
MQLRAHLGLLEPEKYAEYQQAQVSTAAYALSGAFSFYPNELLNSLLEASFALDTLTLSYQADSKKEGFALEARLPELGFGDFTVEGFRFKVAGDSAGLALETGIAGFNGGAFKIGETIFGLTAKAGDLRQSLAVFQEQEKFMAIGSELYLRPIR